MVEYHPISPRDLSRIHLFAKKVLLEIFLGSELIAGWIWKGDILTANLEDFEKLDASNVYPRSINAKEVLISQKDGEFVFPVADGTAKLSGRDFESRVPTPRREPTVRSEGFSRELHGESGECQPTESKDDAEARADFWSIQVVITMNLEFNSTCRRKKHSRFHSNTLMLPGVLILIWTSCKKRKLTITGMSILASLCQTAGEDSQILLYKKRSLQKDTCCSGRDWQRFKRLPDRIMYGQKFGHKLVNLLRIEKNNNGQKRNRNLTIREDWEEFIFLIQTTENTQKFSENARKLERPVAPAMPCKRQPSIAKANGKSKIVNEKEFKTIYGCMKESHESTRQRPESLHPKTHEDRIAVKGFTFMTL